MSMNPLNDISSVYMQEVLKPQLGKKEGGESSGSGAPKVKKGESTQEASAKRIRQAVYDIRYRARREEVPLQQAFNQYSGKSNMTGPEKSAVKEKLGLTAGGATSESVEYVEEADEKKYMVRVTDKTSGKTYRRYATREKIAQLRANPNISSVEMTQYGTPYEGEKQKGEQTAKTKSGKGLDPVGKEDKDIDNDGDHDKTDKYLLNRRKKIGQAIEKKNVKEGFSNWRQDLSEVMGDEEANVEIKEKKVKNKIKINPELKESIEEIGGTLLEVVEIDEVDFIIESVYDELLEEGYEEDDIEDAIEYALTEANVTYGHDTDKPYQHKKKSGAGQLAKAVGRLARQKLSSKVGDAKKSAKAAVARGARKVAKKALGVARKMEGGKEAPKTAERKPSTYRGAGAGTKERVSSGSYTPPAKKKAEKPSDPWEGSATTPPKEKAKAKPKATTKKTAAPKAKAPAASKKKKTSNLDNLLSSIRNEEVQQIDELSVNKMSAYIKKAEKDRERLNKKWDQGTATPKERKKVFDREEGEARAAKKIRQKTGKDSFRLNALDKLKSAITKEEVQLDEKALSRAQQRFMGMVYAAKKGETPASPEVAKAAAGISKKEARKFAKTKHEGLPEKKVEEAVTQMPGRETTPPAGTTAKQDDIQRKQILANKQKMLQKQQMLQRQELQMQRQGKLPVGHAMEEVEHLDELNRAEKETGINTKTGKPTQKGGAKDDKAFTSVKRMMRGMEGKPAGQRKKEPGKKPPVAGQYGAPKSPAQKVAQRRAAAQRAQDNMSSRFD
jgi:2-hydroxy-3-keto-5-methylthiopentenyl-1-phosphate phosphatase